MTVSACRAALKRLALLCLLSSGALAPTLAHGEPVHSYATTQSGAMGAPLGGWAGALLLGLDIPPSGLDVGPRISGEFMYGAADLAPKLRLDVGFRPSFAFHGGNGVSQSLFDLVPDLKLVFGASPLLAIYGDFGLGLGIIHTSVDFGPSDTTTTAAIQFGFGFGYALTPALNLLGEARFDIYTRNGSSTYFALPTIGLQWH